MSLDDDLDEFGREGPALLPKWRASLQLRITAQLPP
jgi:hypothetical protein